MHGLIKATASLLPRRHRRFWRHVSARRRGVGLALFALVILGIYGWWHFTNDQRVRATAERYLHRLTGASVRIRSAGFSLSGGIRLEGVRLFYRQGDRTEELLEAREVLLRHRPASLLLSGRLEVTEVICVAPVLTLTEEADGHGWNYRRLLKQVTEGPPTGSSGRPAVRLRDGRVVFCESVQGGMVEVGSLSLNISAVPQKNPDIYDVDLEGPDGRGHGSINIITGRTDWTGDAPWLAVSRALPRQYRLLAERYGIKGNLQFKVDHAAGKDAASRLSVTLSEGSMTLPPEQGAMAMKDLAGTIVIGQDIRLEGLSGKLVQWGDAPVRVQGELAGLEATDKLKVTIESDLMLPLPPVGQESVDHVIGRCQRQIRPAGPAAISVVLSREAGGALKVSGQLRPQGMSARLRAFSYPVEQLEGQVDFDSDTVYIRRLTGKGAQGPAASVSVTGRIDSIASEGVYDLTVKAENLPFDDRLREAMWESVQPIYDAFRPAGACDVVAHVHGPDSNVQADLDIDLAGKASLAICADALRSGEDLAAVKAAGGDPPSPSYRLEGVSGHIRVVGDVLRLEAVRGRCEQTALQLDGTISSFSRKQPDIELSLVIERLKLEDKLAQSLGGEIREIYSSFHPSGEADIAGTVRHRGGRVDDFKLTATLKGVSFTYDGFPYPVRQATGALKMTPQRIQVERVAGSVGRGKLSASGEVRPGDPIGIDLRFEASDIALDQALRQALPAEAVGAWEMFAPRGQADATVELRLGPPAPEADGEARKPYSITLDTRRADSPGIAICYSELPYPIENIHGLLKIEPDLAQASDLYAGTPQSPIRLAGTLKVADGRVIVAPGDGATAGPVLIAENLAVDERLLAALPKNVRSVLTPGGTLDLEINRLAWDLEAAESPQPPATKMAAAPPSAKPAAPGSVAGPTAARVETAASAPSTQPAATRSIAGRLKLRQVAMGGSEGLRMTGQIDVRADLAPGRSALQAELDLEQLELNSRPIQHVRGRLVKSAAEPVLRMQDLRGSAYGGRLAGTGELALGNIMAYWLTVNAEQIDLSELLMTKEDAADETLPMTGRLAGRLALRGVIGQTGQREASGELVITHGRLVRVPIILGLVNTVFLQLPTSDAFSDGRVEYLLRGNSLALRNIFLSGANASILGSGHVDLSSEKVDLVFVSGAPKLVPTVVAELWQMTAEGLAPTLVSGTWRHPKTQTVPLSELRHLLQEMGNK